MALNWAERVKLAEEDLARAEAEDAIWQKSPEKRELDAAREREEAAEKARDVAYEAWQAAKAAAAIELGIRPGRGGVLVKRGSYITDRYSLGFLAAAAEQIGCTYEEAEAMTGLNSFHGGRVTGQQCYAMVLDTIADAIIDRHPAVKAAEATYRRAKKEREKAGNARSEIVRKCADRMRRLGRARDVLATAQANAADAAEKAKAARNRRDVEKGTAPAEVKKLADAKARLLKLDAKHGTVVQFGHVERAAEAVEWWPPKLKAVKP